MTHRGCTVPPEFRLAFDCQTIEKRIAELGAEISPWLKSVRDSGSQVLAICILRGGVFFFADLLRAFSESVEPSFCRCESYSSGNNQQKNTFKMLVEPTGLTGRDVLFVDDICDSGQTLDQLSQHAIDVGARSVKTAVLVHRLRETPRFLPDWAAFPFEGDQWLVGYGMEDRNHFSNLPEVHVISKAPTAQQIPDKHPLTDSPS